MALRGQTLVDAAAFIHQDGSVARHGNQDVARPHLLKLLRVGDNGLVRRKVLPKEFTQFVVVGLNQEGLVF